MCEKDSIINKLMARYDNKWKTALSVVIEKLMEYEATIEEQHATIQRQKEEIFFLEKKVAELIPRNRLWLKEFISEIEHVDSVSSSESEKTDA